MIDLFRLVRSLTWLALFGALYQELRKPAEQRTWHGRLFGAVPYDFRIPSWEQVRTAYWNPSSERVFTDRVFGVGWAVNIPVAARKLSAGATQYLRASRRGAHDEEPIPLPQRTES